MDILSERVKQVLGKLFNPAQQNPMIDPGMSQPGYKPPDPGLMSGDYNPADIARKYPSMNDTFSPPDVNLNPATMPPQNGYDDVLRSMMQPQTSAQDRLNEMLSSQPQHKDNQPGFWRKLGSGMISLNDPRLGETFRNRKYDEADEDWKGKLKPISELADSERAVNNSNRMNAATLLRDQQANDRIAATIRGQDKQVERTQMTLDQKNHYLNTYLMAKLQQPNAEFRADDEGNVYSVDKKTGKFISYLTAGDGSKVKSSVLPDAKELAIRHSNALGEIAARGDVQERVSGNTVADKIAVVEAQGDRAVDVSNRTVDDKIKVKGATPGKNTNPVEKSADSQEKVSVVNPQGKKGKIPLSDLPAALKEGYKVVQ